MPSVVDYDKHYRNGRGQCGEPFAPIVDFFERRDGSRLRVLDLGCGQGRDALMIARRGHEVVGIDLSEIGIAQLQEDARAEGLAIDACVADVESFRTRRKFDVVLLDRVLHLLPSGEARDRCLERALRATRCGGYILVADTPGHAPHIQAFFDAHEHLHIIKRTRNYLFAQK